MTNITPKYNYEFHITQNSTPAINQPHAPEPITTQTPLNPNTATPQKNTPEAGAGS